MHRISRDKQIINFDKNCNNKENTIILCYGEVDCRCHIGKQILLGRTVEEICKELVNGYVDTIKTVIYEYKKIIICSITPPMNKELHENKHGPVTHEFPFIGTDDERVIYTKLMNNLLKEHCDNNGFYFLDTYEYYADKDGLLRYELSDTICHIENNSYICYKLLELLEFT